MTETVKKISIKEFKATLSERSVNELEELNNAMLKEWGRRIQKKAK
jgi:hypothetical protein